MLYETNILKNPYDTMQSKPKLEKCHDLKKNKNIKALFNHNHIILKMLN